MPETAVNKYDFPLFWENDVGLSGKGRNVELERISARTGDLPHQESGFVFLPRMSAIRLPRSSRESVSMAASRLEHRGMVSHATANAQTGNGVTRGENYTATQPRASKSFAFSSLSVRAYEGNGGSHSEAA